MHCSNFSHSFHFRGNIDDAPKCDESNMKIRVWVNPQKASIYSTEGAIGEKHLHSSLFCSWQWKCGVVFPPAVCTMTVLHVGARVHSRWINFKKPFIFNFVIKFEVRIDICHRVKMKIFSQTWNRMRLKVRVSRRSQTVSWTGNDWWSSYQRRHLGVKLQSKPVSFNASTKDFLTTALHSLIAVYSPASSRIYVLDLF